MASSNPALEALWTAAHTVQPPASSLSSPEREGFLLKRGEKSSIVSRGKRPWARRWFALSRGLLFYFETAGKKGTFKGCLRLDGGTVEDVSHEKIDGRDGCFVVRLTGDKRPGESGSSRELWLSEPDASVRGDWISTLRTAITRLEQGERDQAGDGAKNGAKAENADGGAGRPLPALGTCDHDPQCDPSNNGPCWAAFEANLPKQGTCSHEPKCTSRNKGPCWQISRQLLQMQLGGDFGEDAAADADAAVRRAVGKDKQQSSLSADSSVNVYESPAVVPRRRTRGASVDARLGIRDGMDPRSRCMRETGAGGLADTNAVKQESAIPAMICHRCAYGIGYNVCVSCDAWLGHREDLAPPGPPAVLCAKCDGEYGGHCAKCGTIVTLRPTRGRLCAACTEMGAERCAYMRKK